MAVPTRTLFVEGTTNELTVRLAQFIDSLTTDGKTEAQVKQAEDKPEEALKVLVDASAALNSAPENDIIPAYNLLIHLAQHSESSSKLFPRICQNLCQPIPSSNGSAIALSVLTSIFNLFPAEDVSRYHVLLSSIQVVRASSSFALLKPQLKQLPTWLSQWNLNDRDERALYLAIYEAAEEADDTDSFTYLLAALRSFPPEDSSEPPACELAIKALKVALLSPTVYDYSDLTALDSIQALRESDSNIYELLDIFVGQTREDFDVFLTDYPNWLEENGLDVQVLTRKINLLTLASLAASASQTRSIPYEDIAKALKVPDEEVEMWVIDVIRAGLVEGKLSQSTKTFLVHRTTYRIFGDKQWQEVASRLDVWRTSLTNVLQVLRSERANLAASIEQAEHEAKNGNAGNSGSGERRHRNDYHRQGQDQDHQQRRRGGGEGGGNRGGQRRDNNNRHHNNNNNNADNNNRNNNNNNARMSGPKDIQAEA